MNELRSTDAATSLRRLVAPMIVLGVLAGLYTIGVLINVAGYLGDVVKLYFAAWVWHFLLAPPIDWLCARRVPRSLAAMVAYLGAIVVVVGILLLLIPTVVTQFTLLGHDLLEEAGKLDLATLSANLQLFIREHAPESLKQPLIDGVKNGTSRLQHEFDTLSSNVLSLVQHLTGTVVNSTFTLVGTTLDLLFFGFTMLILAFFMTMSGEAAVRPLIALLPRSWEPDIQAVNEEIERAFGGFVRGQLVLSTVYAVLIYLLLQIFGLLSGGHGHLSSFAVATAVLSGIIMIIPAVGTMLSMLPPMLIGLLTIGWPLSLVLIVAVWLVNLLMANIIGPRVMSQAVGINPVWSFGALLIGGKLGGILGAFFSVPILAVAIVVAQRILLHLHRRYGEQTAPGTEAL
jgi:predicted PurR-regulated permease PerM